MQIVAVDKVRLFPEHIKKLKYHGSLTIYNDIPSKKEGILRLQNADIAIVHWYKMPKAVLKSVPKLKAVMLASTGTDRIDLLAAKKTGITVCNVPKYCVEATAQFTIGALLNASRFIIKSVEDVKHGEYFSYNYKGIKGIELQGKTLGIVGFGLIGRKVAEIAKKGFGMNIIYIDSNSSRKKYELLLRTSDVISVHSILNRHSASIISNKEFDLMKQNVIFINTTRSAIVDNQALFKNIKSGNFFAVVLDVMQQEPVKKTHPFLSFSNVIVTPHIAFNTIESEYNLATILTKNILRFIKNSPQNVVI